MTSCAGPGTISISVWPGETTPPTVKMLRPTTWPDAGARTRARCSCSRTAISLGSTSDSRAWVSRSSVATSPSAVLLDRHATACGSRPCPRRPGRFRRAMAASRPRSSASARSSARMRFSDAKPFSWISRSPAISSESSRCCSRSERSAANSRLAARPAGASAGRAPTAAPTSRQAAPGVARAAAQRLLRKRPVFGGQGRRTRRAARNSRCPARSAISRERCASMVRYSLVSARSWRAGRAPPSRSGCRRR